MPILVPGALNRSLLVELRGTTRPPPPTLAPPVLAARPKSNVPELSCGTDALVLSPPRELPARGEGAADLDAAGRRGARCSCSMRPGWPSRVAGEGTMVAVLELAVTADKAGEAMLRLVAGPDEGDLELGDGRAMRSMKGERVVGEGGAGAGRVLPTR